MQGCSEHVVPDYEAEARKQGRSEYPSHAKSH
jgi:hypothetical protein